MIPPQAAVPPVAKATALIGWLLLTAACSRSARNAHQAARSPHALAPAVDADVSPAPDAGPSAPQRFVEQLPWQRGGAPVEGCTGQDKWIGPGPLPAKTLVRFVYSHHFGSHGVIIATDGSRQVLDPDGKTWSPRDPLSPRQRRQLSQQLAHVNLGALFPAYFSTREIHDQGSISIDVPEGPAVRSVLLGTACRVPELRELLPLLSSLAQDD